MWQRQKSSLHISELPSEITERFQGQQQHPEGIYESGFILCDREGNFSFAHANLIDFYVAQRIFGAIARGESSLLAAAQTSHDTDLIIQEFVSRHDSSIRSLTGWAEDGSNAVLRVNSAGILAKMERDEIANRVIQLLKGDDGSRHLYLTAVANRVLSIPWGEASLLVGAIETDLDGLGNRLDETDAGRLARACGIEVLNRRDAGARWCSVVLLSQLKTTASSDIAFDALQTALRQETSQEILRSIGSALSGTNPISV